MDKIKITYHIKLNISYFREKMKKFTQFKKKIKKRPFINNLLIYAYNKNKIMNKEYF